MTAPARVLRPSRRTLSRLVREASAAQAIEGFGHGTDVVGLTMGQFSLLDLVGAVLGVTGPADVLVSTWSVGVYDAEAARRWAADGRMRSVRVLMDSGRQARGQAGVTDLVELLGADAVRTCRLHAKFAVASNAEWSAVVTSSMNLNLNARVEHFTLSDDRDWAALLVGFADAVWAGQGTVEAPDRRLPALPGMASAPPRTGVRTAVARTGR